MSCGIDHVQEAQLKAEELRSEIHIHDYLYYVKNEPSVSDAEYDELMRRLRAIESHYPQLITPDSPTQRVGERVAEGFGVVEHREPMLSLANAFKFSELEAWYQRASRLAGTDKFRFVCEPKIDGLAVALVYENGRFVQGATAAPSSSATSQRPSPNCGSPTTSTAPTTLRATAESNAPSARTMMSSTTSTRLRRAR